MSSFKVGHVHQFVDALAGTHEVVPITHRIDTDAAPFIPDGWTVEEHRGDGILEWDASKVNLYLDDAQMNGKRIEGNLLRKRLAKKRVLNANLLDFLLENPQLIPDEWKKDENGDTRYVYFWGTIYRGSGGDLCVRYLYWGGDRWHWGAGWLGVGRGGEAPVAVRAS